VETWVLLGSDFEVHIVHVGIEFIYIFSLYRGICVVGFG
jgi:hypothetical protein